MMAGLLQWIVLILHHSLVGTVSAWTIRTNHNVFWMAGVVDLALFGALGILCAGASRIAGPKATRPLLALLIGLAVLSPLARLEELHLAASAFLALGVGVSLAPKVLRAGRSPRATRRGIALVGLWSCGMAIGWWSPPVVPRPSPAGPPPAPGAKPPNLILVVWDTARADHLSLYGYGRPTTPFLEEAASRGLVFREARSAAPWTLPSHVSMFTGLLPHENTAGVDLPLDRAQRTLAEELGDRGYATGGIVGNFFYCNSWFGLSRGFQHYEDIAENREVSLKEAVRSSGLGRWVVMALARAKVIDNNGEAGAERPGPAVTAGALDWIDRPVAEGRPFFLFLNYMDAHGPYLGTPEMERPFSKLTNEEYRAIAGKAYRAISARGRPEDGSMTKEEAARLCEAAYDDCLRSLDDQLRVLFEGLESRGLRENTWVVVTSDHGEHFGEHGLFLHGNSLHRPLIHVPLAIIPPRGGAVEPASIDAPASLADLPATFMSLCGAGEGDIFPGRSLLSYCSDSDGGDPPVYSELVAKGGAGNKGKRGEGKRSLRAVVSGGRTLIRRSDGAEQLYDAAADLEERDNLAAKPEEAGRLEGLRQRLRDRFDDPFPIIH